MPQTPRLPPHSACSRSHAAACAAARAQVRRSAGRGRRRCWRQPRASATRCCAWPSRSASSAGLPRRCGRLRPSSSITRASAASTRSAAAALSSCARRRRRIEAFLTAVNLNHALPGSWGMLEGLYRMTGRGARTPRWRGSHVATLRKLPQEVVLATGLFADGDLDAAESLVRTLSAAARRSHRSHAAARPHRHGAQGVRRCGVAARGGP